jgi:hypothetical protein
MLNSPAGGGSLFRLFRKIKNSLTISGFLSHKLVLKVNCIVVLIRNLNTKEQECASSLYIIMLLIEKF